MSGSCQDGKFGLEYSVYEVISRMLWSKYIRKEMKKDTIEMQL